MKIMKCRLRKIAEDYGTKRTQRFKVATNCSNMTRVDGTTHKLRNANLRFRTKTIFRTPKTQ